jgi:signal peptidase I
MEKGPWFYGCLSWLLPGMGHIWAGYFARGILFLLLWLGCLALACYFLLSHIFIGYMPLIVCAIVGGFVLPVAATANMVRCVRKSRPATVINPDPWFAVFLSIILGGFSAGFGYLYLRKWLYAVIWLSAGIIIAKFASNLLIYGFLNLLLFLAVTGHVFILAKKKSNTAIHNFAWVFFVLFAAYECIDYLVLPWLPISSAVTPFDGLSMVPTLKPGDWIVTDVWAYRNTEPQVGDIVCADVEYIPIWKDFRRSQGLTEPEILCKRLVGKGGDLVIIDYKRLTVEVNGKKLQCVPEIQDLPSAGVTKTYSVPPNQYFLLGDNLLQSSDSRFFGAVRREAIKGKVIKIWWPLSEAKILK